MKALLSHNPICFSPFYKENLDFFCLILNLPTSGCERKIQKQTCLNSENGPHPLVLDTIVGSLLFRGVSIDQFLINLLFNVIWWLHPSTIPRNYQFIDFIWPWVSYRPLHQSAYSQYLFSQPRPKGFSLKKMGKSRGEEVAFLRAFLITLIRKISFPALFRRTIKRNKIDENVRAQKGENSE